MSRVLMCGAINWDTTCFVDHLPVPGEEVTCDHVSEVSGGTGANAAVAAARILGAGEVALLGALGRDRLARAQLSILTSEGVAINAIVRLRDQQSGHAYILVDRTGQDIIATNLGANAALNERHVSRSKLSALLAGCRCAVITDPPLPVTETILLAAAATDVPVLWDPGILAAHGWDILAPLTSHVDSLLLNEEEAAQLFGMAEPSDILRSLDLRGAPSCIVLKRGSRGSLLLDRATGDITQIPPLPLESLGLTVVSTVGCGDVFLGAYAAYLALGRGRHDALIAASAAAALNATHPETRGGPTQRLLEDTMKRARPLGFAGMDADGTAS